MTSLPVAPGDRNVPWRDVFPLTWHLKPVKYACSINRRALPETTDPDTEFRYVDISSVDSEGNWSASEPMRFGDAPSRARRIVADGDVLVSTVRTYLRAIAHVDKVDEPLICSTGFAVLSANGAAYSRFLAYWARSVYFVDEVVARSVGISYPAVNASDVGNIPCPLLPLHEQRAIAAFLDRETARIDALIEKKRRQIELLQEKRTALISHAVTKGLDPKAPMKDSGIDWIGPIPSHWTVARVKHIARLESGHTPSRSVPEHWLDSNDIPWVSLNDTKWLAENDWITDTTYNINALGLQNSSARLLPARVVVFTRDATIGKAAITTRPMAVSQHLIAWVCGPKLLPEYLLRVFYTMEPALERYTFGATIKTIGMDDVRALVTPLPPLDDQLRIVHWIGPRVERIAAVVRKVEVSIDRLREYRTSLISAAVTGKIDVRKEVA